MRARGCDRPGAARRSRPPDLPLPPDQREDPRNELIAERVLPCCTSRVRAWALSDQNARYRGQPGPIDPPIELLTGGSRLLPGTRFCVDMQDDDSGMAVGDGT